MSDGAEINSFRFGLDLCPFPTTINPQDPYGGQTSLGVYVLYLTQNLKFSLKMKS